MNILGISTYYHDSAVALVRDGEIIAAAGQEERVSRKKHDSRFPTNTADYCLQAGELTAEQLDYVVFYEKPLVKFKRLLETYIAYLACTCQCQPYFQFSSIKEQLLRKGDKRNIFLTTLSSFFAPHILSLLTI